jgi:hypothetical protein
LVALVGLNWGGAGCVDTAECNAAVTCPGDDVCYEYRCRERCETDAQCAEDQICEPCRPIAGTNDQGKCFGRDLNACVQEEG